MKTSITTILLLGTLVSVGNGQINLLNTQVDTKAYPAVNCAFSLMDTNYRVVIAPDLGDNSILADSATKSILPFQYISGQASPKDHPIEWINSSGKDTSVIFTPGNRQPISLLLSVDLSDSAMASTGYGNVSVLKSLLRHIVNVLDLSMDKVAIQVVDSNVSIPLQWTDSLEQINYVIDHIESYRSTTTWCYNLAKALGDPNVGMYYYGKGKNIHQVANPYNIVIFAGTGRHDYMVQDDNFWGYTSGMGMGVDGNFEQLWLHLGVNGYYSAIYVAPTTDKYETEIEYIDTNRKNIYGGTKQAAFFGNHGEFFAYAHSLLMPWHSTFVWTADTSAQLQYMALKIQTAYQRLDGTQTTSHLLFNVFDTTKAVNTVLLKNDKYDMNEFIHIINPNLPMSVPLSNQDIQIAVYPNPATSYIVVPGVDNERVTIDDQNGKIVMTGFANVPISIGNCAQGTYYITTSKLHHRAKIVIVK